MPDKLQSPSTKQAIYYDVLDFARNSLTLEDFFVFIYGSYATSHFTQESDLDIVFATETYNDVDFDRIQDFVFSQHAKYRLTIDQEVPYRNKLLVTYEDIVQAASLDVFGVTEDGRFLIPEITDDIDFLASQDARKRLLLNAMTTPHVLIHGNQEAYGSLRTACEKAIVRLARGMGNAALMSSSDLLASLLNQHEDGSSGRAYLGYKEERQEVIDHLEQVIVRHSE